MATDPVSAVIDVGSNSIKLLVARPTGSDWALETVYSETIETRISEGISKSTPRLQDAAMRAGIAAIRSLLDRAAAYAPSKTAIVATSAVRDAVNGAAFAALVESETGVPLQILSGDEEARGIACGLAYDPAVAAHEAFVQADLGGGSMELIAIRARRIEQAVSTQLGAVRITEQFVSDRSAPLGETAYHRIRDWIDRTIADSGFTFPPLGPVVATGGAATVTRAILAAADSKRLTESSPWITIDQLRSLHQTITFAALNARYSIPELPAARADIFPAALTTLERVLELSGRDALLHSVYNLRYGIAAGLLA